jgi:hypothetical protein
LHLICSVADLLNIHCIGRDASGCLGFWREFYHNNVNAIYDKR